MSDKKWNIIQREVDCIKAMKDISNPKAFVALANDLRNSAQQVVRILRKEGYIHVSYIEKQIEAFDTAKKGERE